MPQENVEIAVGYFEAADLASAIDALAEDVRLVFHGQLRELAGADTISGKKAAVDWLADWFSRFEPNYRVKVEESRELGNRVLVVTFHRAKGRASGVPISRRTANVVAVCDNKIVRHDFFDSREEALEAARMWE
jgi:ketosteroid isomerase-like protein